MTGVAAVLAEKAWSLQEATRKTMSEDEFYLRYYVGHKGRFGHEFLEFEFRPNGKLRYANNSHYKNETMIRKEGIFIIIFFSLASIDLARNK